MKLFFQVVILAVAFGVCGCRVQRASQTSSVRAAYGNAPDFKAHKKKNQKKKRKARRGAERKKSRNSQSLWRGRPY